MSASADEVHGPRHRWTEKAVEQTLCESQFPISIQLQMIDVFTLISCGKPQTGGNILTKFICFRSAEMD